MKFTIKKLARQDYRKVIDFAIQGMNFTAYLQNPWALRLYGRYFLYLELNRASQVIAAYQGERVVGVLLADFVGQKLYVKIFKSLMTLVAPGSGDVYDEANQELLQQYLTSAQPDGEICFLAADPTLKGQGVGSLLLQELQRRAPHKLVYLYTDSNCTYQFYEKKGFHKAGAKTVQLALGQQKVPLTCLLYSKVLA